MNATYEEILETLENFVSQKVEEAALTYKEQGLIHESVFSEEEIDYVLNRIVEEVSEFIPNIANFVAEGKVDLETAGIFLEGVVYGTAKALIHELSLSPQVKEKLKKALKIGGVVGGLGALATGAAYAATHPEQVKDMASQAGEKLQHGVEAIKQKIHGLIHHGTQTAGH